MQVAASPQREVVEVEVGLLPKKAGGLEVVGVLVGQLVELMELEGLEEQGVQPQQRRPASLSPVSPVAPSPAAPSSDAPVFSGVPAPVQRVHSELNLRLLVH